MVGRRRQKNEESISGETEFINSVIINDNVYLENEIPTEVVDDLHGTIDEDWLYEDYRDRKFEQSNRNR